MDIETLDTLAEILQASSANRLSVETPDWSVELEAPYGAHPAAAVTAAAAAPEPVAPPAVEPSAPPMVVLEAGMVGVFHSTSPALPTGDFVGEGDVLGSIESLAIRTEVRSSAAGEVAVIHVEDGQPVEYGQPLFSIIRAEED